MQRLIGLSPVFVLLLSACSSISDLPAGTPLSEIEQQFGSPRVACPADNPNRFIWSTQPMGQFAWAVDTTPTQDLKSVTQVLTDAEFDLLRQGSWAKEQVWCHFGPPAEQSAAPYKGVTMQIWSYRYKQNKAWDALMHIYFDESNRVKHHHPAPDPLLIDEWNIFSGL